MKNIIIGLNIFLNHNGTNFYAKHDEIHAGQKEGEELSKEEIQTLDEAGWFRNGGECWECPTDAEGETQHLSNCNNWMKFV